MKREMAKLVLFALALLTLVSAEPTLAGTSQGYQAGANSYDWNQAKP
ncbi:MAG: hypothetical protein LBT59_25535 [Clostridiales bacterium]|jgi:hypothetical protein|nr:hypothetical protein [Clostridiales bacterium]